MGRQTQESIFTKPMDKTETKRGNNKQAKQKNLLKNNTSPPATKKKKKKIPTNMSNFRKKVIIRVERP